MIHVKLTQNVGNWLTGTELGFIDLTHADAVLGGGTYVQTYPVTPPTQADLDAAAAAAIAYNMAHRYILGSEFDTLSGQLTPGAGQIVVGGASGPVKLPRPDGLLRHGAPSFRDHLAAMRLITTPVATTWETPDGTGVVVHPSVLYFPDGWNGSRWWAAATPYYNSDVARENPCLYVSTDGNAWAPPVGVTNPLVPKPAGANDYNSDPHLSYGPDDKLYLFFRRSYGSTQEELFVTSSADGVQWSPFTSLVTSASNGVLLSPAMWWDARTRQWVMLHVSRTTPETPTAIDAIYRRTAPAAEGPWTAGTVVTMTPANWPDSRPAWHMDARRVGDQVVALISSATRGNGGSSFLAVSTDSGQSFTRAMTPLVYSNTYKSSLLPILTPRGVALDCWIGGGQPSWGVTRARAGLPAFDPATDRTMQVLLASIPANPYIFGDRFARSDNPTGLGTAPSGQAWTTLAGTVQILGGQAQGVGATNNKAAVDVGQADYELTATIDTSLGPANVEAWIMVRVVDTNAYYRVGFGKTALSWGAEQVTGGTPTGIGSGWPVVQNRPDNTVTIRCQGDTITVTINGVQVNVFTGTANPTATKIGVQIPATGGRISDLTVKKLV